MVLNMKKIASNRGHATEYEVVIRYGDGRFLDTGADDEERVAIGKKLMFIKEECKEVRIIHRLRGAGSLGGRTL